MARFGGIPNTRQFRELIREEALPLPTKRKTVPTLPIAPTLPMDMTKLPLGSTGYVEPNVAGETASPDFSLSPGPGLLPYKPFGEEGPTLYGTQEQIDASKVKEAARVATTNEDGMTLSPVAPNAVAQSAIDNLPVNMGAISSPNLGDLGTSGISVLEEILMPDSVSPIAELGISDMDTDMDKEIEKALAAAMAPPSQETVNADIAKLMGMEPQVSVATVDPVAAAVETAVGNGQPTTDDTILDQSGEGFIPPPKGSMNTMAMVPYYNPTTGETFMASSGGWTAPEGWVSGTKEEYEKSLETGTGTGTGTETQQPDFMTQLQELIAQMQAEQTAAAEQQQQQEQQRQEQTAEMTKNYMIGQPAVGYNPYQSGQYQNNPYGAAGVPNMGGITSIPVPAPYQAPRTMT